MQPGRLLPLVGLVSALNACSSDPIASGGGTGGTSGTGGSGGTSGTSGSSGTGGSSVTAPDYTQSACYGQHATTDVYDLATHMVHPVATTCRAEGDHTRFYVADDLWQTQEDATVLGQGEVDAFMLRYELEGTPASAHPELGILPTDEAVFGTIVDASLTDGKLPIFVVDTGGAGDGYLCSWCAKPALHLDWPSLRSLHTEKTLSIAAHESFHAIHRGYDADEEVWVDESLAEAAMTVNGFYTDQDWVGEFLQNTNSAWGPGVTSSHDFDYGAGLLFGTYLWEHGGADLMYAITHEPSNGWTGIDRALVTVGANTTGWQLFQDMALAVFINDPVAGYGFQSIELDQSVLPYVAVTGSALEDTLAPYGLMYVTFEADAASVEVDASADVSARLVLDGDALEVRSLTVGKAATFSGKTPRVLVLTAQASTPVSVTARP